MEPILCAQHRVGILTPSWARFASVISFSSQFLAPLTYYRERSLSVIWFVSKNFNSFLDLLKIAQGGTLFSSSLDNACCCSILSALDLRISAS